MNEETPWDRIERLRELAKSDQKDMDFQKKVRKLLGEIVCDPATKAAILANQSLLDQLQIPSLEEFLANADELERTMPPEARGFSPKKVERMTGNILDAIRKLDEKDKNKGTGRS